MSQRVPVTELLQRWSAGDREVASQLLPHLYSELRRLAAQRLRLERADHTLQPTALVHELYCRLCEQQGVVWHNRKEFFGFAAHVLRRVLVDYARVRGRAKRGGQLVHVTLKEAQDLAAERAPDVLALDEALTRLAAVDARKATIVEMRFFAGFSIEETAAQLGVSPETVGREWRRTKAWLRNELERGSLVHAGRP